MREWLLRRAVPADAAAMHAVIRDSYAVYLPRMDRAPAPMTSSVEELAGEPDAWVAEDGRVIGLIVLRDGGDHLLVDTVAVDPGAQGRGVGSGLLDLAELVAAERGLRQVRLYTNEAMTENLAWYPARGYTETGRAVQDGYRRVFFAKTLHKGA